MISSSPWKPFINCTHREKTMGTIVCMKDGETPRLTRCILEKEKAEREDGSEKDTEAERKSGGERRRHEEKS